MNSQSTDLDEILEPIKYLSLDDYDYSKQQEIKQAILAWNRKQVLDARIDELREVQEYYVADYIDTTAGKNIDNYIESRITELEGKNNE